MHHTAVTNWSVTCCRRLDPAHSATSFGSKNITCDHVCHCVKCCNTVLFCGRQGYISLAVTLSADLRMSTADRIYKHDNMQHPN